MYPGAGPPFSRDTREKGDNNTSPARLERTRTECQCAQRPHLHYSMSAGPALPVCSSQSAERASGPSTRRPARAPHLVRQRAQHAHRTQRI